MIVKLNRNIRKAFTNEAPIPPITRKSVIRTDGEVIIFKIPVKTFSLS